VTIQERNLSLTPDLSSKFADLRVLVLREDWIGCTGLSAFNALLRLHVKASSIIEGDYIPLAWRSIPLKVVARLLRPIAVREFNRILVDQVKISKPDLFLVFKGPFVTGDAVRAIKESGTVCYCYYPDVSTTNHGPYLPVALPKYDWIFTTKSFGARDPQKLYGIDRVTYLPHAFDPMVHNPQEFSSKDIAEYGCEVSFIGAWSRKKQNILEGLVMRRPGLRLKIWGNGWENLPHASLLKPFVAFRAVTGIAYATAISCSEINLGLLYEGPPGALSGDKITSRSFHIPACGGLLLHERTEDFLQIFAEGVNCVCFDGSDELASQVETLLSDQSARQRIAAEGYKLVRGGHSWDHRIRTILEHYFNNAVRNIPRAEVTVGCR
jgi:hypothetical protein